MRSFGLIGYPLSHSFSMKYFAKKFSKEHIEDCKYEAFEIKEVHDFKKLLLNHPQLEGLNVTIPYKEKIIPYLDKLDGSAKKVGAVNVIKIDPNGYKTGYNSDYFGFRQSLEKWLGTNISKVSALILGTGGASKAVKAVCEDCNIHHQLVSREPGKGDLTYFDLNNDHDIFTSYKLIVNTTPMGMFPRINEAPNLPYEYLDNSHYLYDLIYNPETTLFMKKGSENGAGTKNGLEMLIMQAEKSWEIWNKR